MFAALHSPLADLSSIADAFSPAHERTTPDTVVFSIDGLQRLHGSPHQIAQSIARRAGPGVNIAISETADAAILAARNLAGVSVFPDLSALPIDRLALENEMLEVLDSWGIRTFAQLAQLPENGLAERFGPEGVRIRRLALGVIRRPLKIFQPETTYEDRIDLDHPVSLLEPLLFLIARILNEQCGKLLSNAMAANEIHLRLELEDKTEHHRTLRLPVPMRNPAPLLKLLQMDLEAHPPQAPTMAIALTLHSAPPRTVQNGIFLPPAPAPAPDKLELTLARIRGLVGEANIGIPELLDTHHPHPFHLTNHQPYLAAQHAPAAERQAFRYFRPPIGATVELGGNRPIRIQASGIAGAIATASGPWRTSGDWWTASGWNRDEWDITLASGALYRIYREPAANWFVEGAYD
jgi:protein ImuB